MDWYNGWSLQQRLAVIPLQREAVASGAMPRPRNCSICGAGWSRENPIWLHDENYAEPLTAYAICRSCHRALHERFDHPEPWHALVERHGSGNDWFEMLSMDARSLRQSFETTYPNGLPQPVAKGVVSIADDRCPTGAGSDTHG